MDDKGRAGPWSGAPELRSDGAPRTRHGPSITILSRRCRNCDAAFYPRAARQYRCNLCAAWWRLYEATQAGMSALETIRRESGR